MKIKKVKKYKENVYDISVPLNQNFLLANGAVAHNCSHAASYAIVAYNCMYLKYHYPIHFWKGMLTIRSGDEDKLKEMLKECQHYILPVDIVKSHATDWLIEGDKLRSPLSLIKGCGEKGVQNLIQFINTPLDQINLSSDIKEEEETEESDDEVE